tara:strand:- start:1356 stop:1751 length:396 start_codon:yes stop_codon:yes gene_type:complete
MINPKYRIVYSDPDDDSTNVCIVSPSPRWLQKAMSGGLPPVSVYWDLKEEERTLSKPGVPFYHSKELLHKQYTAPRIKPLTEEEAMEYLILKDVPRSVWGRRHNRPMVRIIKAENLPKPSEWVFSEAWEMR